MDYPGKVITKTQVTPTQTSASGNWTLDDQAAAIKNNNWPVALVPNPISKSLRFNSDDRSQLHRWASLTPSSFGMTNPQTGQWIPLKYSGTYGTNGFYLNFKDATSTTTLGYDYSGNANNWTTNNFSVTAGVGNDSLTDVPTPWIAYNTTGDVGGVIRSNYCTMNPLQYSSTYVTLNNGNLNVTGSSGVDAGGAFGTAKVNSGKWYWEATIVAVSGTYPFIGFAVNTTGTQYQGGARVNTSGTLAIASPESFITLNGSPSGTSFTTNDVLQFALDMDNGKMWIGKNGTWMNSGVPASGTGNVFSISDKTQFVSPFIFSYNSSQVAYNFGQRQFGYTPPTGFRSLCTTNLPPTDIGFGLTNQANKYMNVVTYTGTGSSLGVTGVGFQPDLVWIKSRSATTDHGLYDAVRGVQNQLESNTTTAETVEATGLTAFGADGFTVGALAQLNTSSATYVGWNWKASNATAVTNTAGTITSTVSANTTAGFSIVTYTGNGSTGTIGHGLNFAPDMVIVKGRNTINLDWVVYHKSLTSAAYALFLNATNIQTLGPTYWNSTAPTNTVFSVGADNNTNKSATTYVAYCFDTVPGYSAFDSYTANNAVDGVFVYLGFRPEWLMIKRATTTAGNSWVILDAARNTFNVTNNALYPNQTYAENGTIGAMPIDFLSNGFKIRTDSSEVNGTGTYIYAAFAESPFQFANAR
jgi:hypothetical protein